MGKSITKRYHIKKNNTLSTRNVGFELTLAQYSRLVSLATTCDYTGVTFDNLNTSSIERIDPSLPYHEDNCCMVTVHANRVKAYIDDKQEHNIKLKDLPVLNRIQETLSTKSREELVAKYKENYIMKITKNKQDSTLPSSTNTTNLQDNPDLDIAKQYLDFCNSVDGSLSFSRFKKLYNKKTCDWSGASFSKDNPHTKPKLSKINKDQPFRDDNTMVVCTALAALKDRGSFSKKNLINFISFL